MSNEQELAQSESQEQSANPSPESQETPKLLPTILPSLETPPHHVNPSTTSAESAASMQNAPSDVPSASTESIMVTIGEDVQKTIANIIKDTRYPTATLQRLADLHLEKFEHAPRNNRLLHTPKTLKEKVDAYKIIWAMWDYVKDRTGDRYEHSKRYTAAAIVTCGDDIQKFVALANTWFVLFLWPFRAQSHYDKHESTLSEAATPTFNETASAFRDPGSNKPGNRDEKMAKEVLRRDNYTCIVSGSQTPEAHHFDKKLKAARLECAHIFKRSVAKFSASKDHNAITTLDIIRNYCPQPAWSLSLLDEKFDSPCNGIAMHSDPHIYFDEYKFCFIPVDGKDHTYKLKAFEDVHGVIPFRDSEELTFKDHSHLHTTDAFAPEHTMETRSQAAGPAPQSTELPDPWFLSIHAAVAHVLHASDAAEFIDSFLKHDEVGPSSSAEMKGVRDIELRFLKLDLEYELSHGNPTAFEDVS